VRYEYNNNYFDDRYQGIPVGGYNQIIEKMIRGCDIELGVDYNEKRRLYDGCAEKIVYTGTIDSYYDYVYGRLEYRSLKFETRRRSVKNHQGVAVMNFTDADTPYTRIIEHKHFEFGLQPYTYITKEFSCECDENTEPYYPINDAKNQELYAKYQVLASREETVIFGGRLAEYKYYNMDQIVEAAVKLYREENNSQRKEWKKSSEKIADRRSALL